MSVYSEHFLRKNLTELTTKQQSVVTLSLWIIHHRKHHSTIVKIWFRQLRNAPSDQKRLTLMWLANDVIQNGSKKGPEYTKAFAKVLPKAFDHIGRVPMTEKVLNEFTRMLNIWEERGVYNAKMIKECRACLNQTHQDVGGFIDSKYDPSHNFQSIISQRDACSEHSPVPYISLREPPKPEELIEALTIVENSPSGDVEVRQIIANLPPEVSNVKHIHKLRNKNEVLDFSKKVNEAADLLTVYNAQLSAEVNHRTTLETMLHDFASEQKVLLEKAEKRLEEHNENIAKLKAFREQVKEHRSKLPNLSQLPDVTSGLTPLPSVENLFKTQNSFF